MRTMEFDSEDEMEQFQVRETLLEERDSLCGLGR